MRDQASVVIIGAGIVGCSAAYHLAQLGWRISQQQELPKYNAGDQFGEVRKK